MRVPRYAMLRAVAVALALSLLPAGPASAADLSPADRMLARVNHYRTVHGLAPVVLDARLSAAALAHSRDMATADFFAHEGSDGGRSIDRMARAGYFYRVAAENIAGGLASPEQTVDKWMGSDGHRRNILLTDAPDAGVGYVFLSDDPGSVRYRHYWTLTLGAER